MEIIKLVVLVIRKRKTVPAPYPVPVPSSSSNPVHQSRIYRAQSLPDIYNRPAVTLRRKNSPEIKETRTLPLPIKSQVLKEKPVQAIVMKQPILVKQNITFEHVRNVTKDMCIRTSGLSTVMAFLCFGLTVANMVNIFITAYIVVTECRFCLVLSVANMVNIFITAYIVVTECRFCLVLTVANMVNIFKKVLRKAQLGKLHFNRNFLGKL